MKPTTLAYFLLNLVFIASHCIGIIQEYKPGILTANILGFIVAYTICVLIRTDVKNNHSIKKILAISVAVGIAMMAWRETMPSSFLNPMFLFIGSSLGGISAVLHPIEN